MKKNIKKSKFLKIVIFTVILIFITCVINCGFLKGSITEYTLRCPSDFHERNSCYAFSKTIYYPNKSKQEVISKNFFGILALKKCTVLNRKNWECKYNDESAVFGFNNGKFYSTTLWSNVYSQEEIIKQSLEYKHVSKFRYFLENLGII